MIIRKFRQRITLVIPLLILFSLVAVTVTRAQAPIPSSEPNSLEVSSLASVAYDSATSTGQPPDDNPKAEMAQAAQTFLYYFVSGTTLRPRNSSTGYAYDLTGCAHVTAALSDSFLNTELILPEGAIIKYLRLYYKDTNAATSVNAYLTRYQPGLATADLTLITSTVAFAGGYGFVVSTELTETVDNTNYAYTLLGLPGDFSAANQICGLRVAYYAPTTSVFLPVIAKP